MPDVLFAGAAVAASAAGDAGAAPPTHETPAARRRRQRRTRAATMLGAAWAEGARWATASALAFESELGVHAPLGSWGPRGISSGGNGMVKRQRSLEIKRDWKPKMATFGYIAPEVTGKYTDFPFRVFDSELGAQAPMGYWDPAGYSKDGGAEAPRRRRCTEIKHGRVSMTAYIGHIVPEYFKWPGFVSPSAGLGFADVPNDVAVFSKIPTGGRAQTLFTGLLEVGYLQEDGRAPGDFASAEPLSVPRRAPSMTSAEARKTKINVELAKGRLAMMAVIGGLIQDGLAGAAWGDWAFYTDSPIRAFESELGVQTPVGYWGPAGCRKAGDAEARRHGRCTEIKHGRGSLIACIGHIVPQYFKLPGVVSPSAGLNFADVLNGVAALSKIPAGGWTHTSLFAGLLAAGYFEQEDGGAPGDVANAGPLGVPKGAASTTSAEARRTKLNAEAANGRSPAGPAAPPHRRQAGGEGPHAGGSRCQGVDAAPLMAPARRRADLRGNANEDAHHPGHGRQRHHQQRPSEDPGQGGDPVEPSAHLELARPQVADGYKELQRTAIRRGMPFATARAATTEQLEAWLRMVDEVNEHFRHPGR